MHARVPAGVLTMTNGKDEDRCMHGPGYIYINYRSAHLERNMSLLIYVERKAFCVLCIFDLLFSSEQASVL